MRSRPTGRGRMPPPLLALGLGAALVLPASASAGPLGRALDNLQASQDPIGGGFGVRGGSDPFYTSWAALAVSASGEDIERWRRGGPSLREALRQPLPNPSIGDIQRLAVAAGAAGLDLRSVGGRNLVRDVLRAQRTDGTMGPDASTTAWGVMALVAGGLGPGSASVSAGADALEAIQGDDGGWSLGPDMPESGTNTTGAAIQALVAAGRTLEASPSLRRARAFLLSAQNRDGGFAPAVGGSSTALTTAWVSLAIRALGERPGQPPWNRAGGPLRTLVRFQGRDGGVRNVRNATETSVWPTSVVALAYAGKYLPYRRVLGRRVPSRAPRLLARTPRPGGRLAGNIRVAYRDEAGGTGVDPGRVRISVGGEDLTGRAVVTARGLKLGRRAIPVGRSTVRLTLVDRAGNARVLQWAIVTTGR